MEYSRCRTKMARMIMRASEGGLSMLLVLSLLCSVPKTGCVNDTITINQIITDGETITSSGGSFEMGFFSPNNSRNRYVGMWYKKISVQTVVWVANREIPLLNKFGYLKVIKPGLLVLCNGRNKTIWSTNSSKSVENPIAQLLDTGNLVVKDATDGDQVDNFLWQSFDHPTDTLLPGMKLGWNFETGFEVYLSSWKSSDDPATGEYSSHFVKSGYPQKMLKKGSVIVYRNGPWNGVGFSGRQILRNNTLYTYRDVFNDKELYFTYDLISNIIARFTLTPTGVVQRLTWNDQAGSWKLYLATPAERCDSYDICGAYGSCDSASSTCSCLDKFSPKFPQKWASLDWSGGCIRNIQLDCHRGDGFMKFLSYKLPDTRTSWFDRNMSLDECGTVCLKNCNCTAYSSLDIRNGGSGCLLWFGDLVDMQVNSENGGQDLHIRMASSESDLTVSFPRSGRKKIEILAICLPLSLGLVVVCIVLVLCFRSRKKKHHKKEAMWTNNEEYGSEHQKKDLELPLLDLSIIIKGTNDFSDDNKLGEGAFGVVYKGYLEGGLEVAVKRLRETSRQGLVEFKNEMLCIAKLQHRNLVKLLGCCLEGLEKILVFEYMPNKSLDSFIFDKTRTKLLDWPKRLSIIQGIARGMLYLHQDSRLRIIHRDLKASNILLDADMNPKISDFGTARSFGGNEIGAKTRVVVGTHGYMSPEYAVDGLFSVKSDIFSFGVVVLEIISGQRNARFSHHDHHHNLLGHSWKLFKEGRALEIVDPHLYNSCSTPEVLRAIHVGLLCVQRYPEDRPSVSSALFMLENEGILPEVKQPGFFIERSVRNVHGSSDELASISTAKITITLLEAR